MIEKIIDLIPTSIEKIKRNIVKYILLLLSLILFITPFIPFNMGKFSFDFNSDNSLSLFEYLLHYNQSVMFLLIALLLIIATMGVAVVNAFLTLYENKRLILFSSIILIVLYILINIFLKLIPESFFAYVLGNFGVWIYIVPLLTIISSFFLKRSNYPNEY